MMRMKKVSIVTDSNVGKGTEIWHFCNIYGAEIGTNVKIGSYVEVKSQQSLKLNDDYQIWKEYLAKNL